MPKCPVCPLRSGLRREGDEWQSRGTICPTVPKHAQAQQGAQNQTCGRLMARIPKTFVAEILVLSYWLAWRLNPDGSTCPSSEGAPAAVKEPGGFLYTVLPGRSPQWEEPARPGTPREGLPRSRWASCSGAVIEPVYQVVCVPCCKWMDSQG